MERSRFFKIELESRSTEATTMLDVELRKDAEWRRSGKLSSFCHTKPSSIFTPLSISSAHPFHVHMAWPFAMIHRYKSLNSNAKAAKASISQFSESIRATSGVDLSLHPSPSAQYTSRANDGFIILPYYREWEHAKFSRVFREAERLFGTSGLKTPRVSFRLSEGHLLHKLMSFNACPGSRALSVVR